MLNQAKISSFKIKKIIKHFSLDLNASKTAPLVGLNRNTINHWFNIFRKAIYAHQYQEFKKVLGEAEVDESYFGARRKRVKLSRLNLDNLKSPCHSESFDYTQDRPVDEESRI